MNDGKAPLNDVKDSDVAFDISGIPAGFVYFGQFIDHDMTLDKTPLTQQQQDPRDDELRHAAVRPGQRLRQGPGGQPRALRPGPARYLLVNPHDGLLDLPRDDVGAAFLGDPRNDENLIVAQLHTVFLRLHNTADGPGQDLRAGPAAAALALTSG